MGFDQYHEPAAELPDETRTFARLCASRTEEAEAEADPESGAEAHSSHPPGPIDTSGSLGIGGLKGVPE